MRCYSNQGQHAGKQQKASNISRLNPALQQQWDHAANAHLGNIDIKPYSNRKVWWTCDQCPDGLLHRWEATIYNRTRGNGCPQCIGHKVCKHNSWLPRLPWLQLSGTMKKMLGHLKPWWHKASSLWHCDVCGHKWSIPPGQRIRMKSGCPKCADHATTKRSKQPTFTDCQDPRGRACLAEWDHKLNAPQGNFPHNTSLKSHKHIFWFCSKCPAGQKHSWSAPPYGRVSPRNAGCPVCAGKAACKCNSLQSLYPDIAADWDYSKNQGQPSGYTASSHRMAWWFSSEQGSWQQEIQVHGKRLKRNQQKHFSAS